MPPGHTRTEHALPPRPHVSIRQVHPHSPEAESHSASCHRPAHAATRAPLPCLTCARPEDEVYRAALAYSCKSWSAPDTKQLCAKADKKHKWAPPRGTVQLDQTKKTGEYHITRGSRRRTRSTSNRGKSRRASLTKTYTQEGPQRVWQYGHPPSGGAPTTPHRPRPTVRGT